jgi:hypothetical protein
VESASRWESLVWPRWLPERARLPVVAQITGAVAFTALLVGPWWSRWPEPPAPVGFVVPHSAAVSLSPNPTSVPLSTLDAAHASNGVLRPAHLNLDVRHNLGSVDLSVTVDGKTALQMKLDGSGKRFKMFGKRSERAYTRTLDLAPGVRVVRVRMRSNDGKFDQARTERLEIGSATVADIRVLADKSGMSLVARHPPLPVAESKPTLPIAPAPLPMGASAVPATAAHIARAVEAKPSPVESAMVELVHSLRSMLIAIAGFVASAATGFVVQEFLRRRRGLLFEGAAGAPPSAAVSGERRRRRRAGKTSAPRDTKTPAPDRESLL